LKTSFFRASDDRDPISIHIYGIVDKTPQKCNMTMSVVINLSESLMKCQTTTTIASSSDKPP
jgi:hypothetical protein